MATLPGSFASIPYHSLLYTHPSPVHPLTKLTSSLASEKPASGPKISIWAKREDQCSPLACCGNKFRKLEYVIPDILLEKSSEGQKVTTLVTEGGIQSNHTAQVAAMAAHLGLESVVLLHRNAAAFSSAADPENYVKTGNVQMCKLLGAEVHYLEPGSQRRNKNNEDTDDHIEPYMQRLRNQRKHPYFIPSGASLHPKGGLGYARCAFEIVEQERQLRNQNSTRFPSDGIFNYIFVACGSGSTLAGLIAGFKLQQQTEHHNSPPRKIVGVLISPTKPLEYHQSRILTLARQAGSQIGLSDPERDITPEDVILDPNFSGTAYGVLDGSTREVIEGLARGDGVVLDPVYTGKVLKGMLGWVGDGGEIGKERGGGNKNVLFIHTGGQTAWGAYVE